MDDGRLDAEGGDLGPQGLGEAVEGELARAVVPLEGQADQAGDGADQDDLARAARAHARKHGLDDAQSAEIVGVELELAFGDGRRLDGAGHAHAGAMHDRIDAALAGEDGCDAAFDGRVVGHVHRDVRPVVDLGGRAAGAVDDVAGRPREQVGAGPAEARGTAGDKNDGLQNVRLHQGYRFVCPTLVQDATRQRRYDIRRVLPVTVRE